MHDRAVVTASGLLVNMQCECDGLRNVFAAAREATAQAVCNGGAACAREAEVVPARDNARTELVQVRNCLTRFRKWVSSSLPALLNIFDSIVGKVTAFRQRIHGCRLHVELFVSSCLSSLYMLFRSKAIV